MKSAAPKRCTPLIGAGLFVLAAVVLCHQLKAYHLHDILRQVRAIPSGRILAALLPMAGSYLVMTGHDLLALRYIRHPLPPAKTALTAFLGYVFSNDIGFSMIAGASVRCRLYSAWGRSAAEITQVVLFCSTSLWLGFCNLSGAVFTFAPLALPRSLHWLVATVRPLGGPAAGRGPDGHRSRGLADGRRRPQYIKCGTYFCANPKGILFK